jgi:hypothetical protein
MYLKPKNFTHVPPPLRPRRTIRVDKKFGKEVLEVDKEGKRADSGTIADVMMVLENMRHHTPKAFRRRGPTRKGKGKGKSHKQTRKHTQKH